MPLREHVQFLGGVRAKVYFRGLEALVPQPQRDLADVAGGLKGVQCAGVPQDMGRHLPSRDRRFGPCCCCDMQRETRGEAAPGHPPSHRVQEQAAVGSLGADGEPCTERNACFPPQRQNAGPPSLAHDPDFVELRHCDIVEAEADQFGDAQTGVVGKAQHRPVPSSGPCRGIRCLEQRIHFVPVEMFERGNIALLLWDRMHLSRHVEVFRVAELEEPVEALDCSQTDVAGTDTVAAFCLKMVEEGENGVDVEMADLERAWADAVPVRGEGREQPEGRGVALDGVSACPPVTREILPQEGCQRGCELGYVFSFPVMCSFSVASETWRMRTGVASRYQ